MEDKITCPVCGTQYEVGVVECYNCGTKLSLCNGDIQEGDGMGDVTAENVEAGSVEAGNIKVEVQDGNDPMESVDKVNTTVGDMVDRSNY